MQARELAIEMEQAYARGDQHAARLLAQQLARSAGAAEAEGSRPPVEGSRAEPRASTEAELQAAARAMLQRTEPDAFLMVIGALDLGVVVWLIYAYVL